MVFVIKGINTLIRGLNKIKPPEWLSNLTGVKGVNFNEIPLLAKGGVVQEEGTAIVGEQGPEVLNLPKGASVTPLSGESSVGIDYDRLMETFVAALRLVAPELRTTVQGEVDRDALVRFLVKENRSSQYMYGKGLLEL